MEVVAVDTVADKIGAHIMEIAEMSHDDRWLECFTALRIKRTSLRNKRVPKRERILAALYPILIVILPYSCQPKNFSTLEIVLP